MSNKVLALAGAALCSFACFPNPASAQGTAFTYQDQLHDGAAAANGIYDLRFTIFDTPNAGTQQGLALTNAATAVSNGLFTVTLDFGNLFSGTDRRLEIGVRTNGVGSFFTLNPRDSTGGDFASQRNDQFRIGANGGARFDVNSNAWVEVFAKAVGIIVPIPKLIDTSRGGFLSAGGARTDSSDRNAKENFSPITPRNVLDQVATLPITRWNYKTEGAAVQHIGPVAQDFQAAFRLSADDKHIAPLHAGGVALAAIQGLNQKLTEELKRRDAENADLKPPKPIARKAPRCAGENHL